MKPDTDHAKVMVPPPLVFLGYAVGAFVLNWAFPFPVPWATTARLVGGLVVLAGLYLLLSAVSSIFKAGTTLDPHGTTTTLVTDGAYRLTRNPIYLSFLLIYLGISLLAGMLWGLLLCPFLLTTVDRAIIHAEEAYLQEKFEDQYTKYQSRVRRWI